MKRPRPRHSTVPKSRPPIQPRRPRPPRAPLPSSAPPRAVGRIIDPADSTLLDVIDNLLNQGVVLNADLILALADVDLVFIRLSALLCAADRLLPSNGPRQKPARP